MLLACEPHPVLCIRVTDFHDTRIMRSTDLYGWIPNWRCTVKADIQWHCSSHQTLISCMLRRMLWYQLDSASLVTGWLMGCSYELCQSTLDQSTCQMLSRGVRTTHSLLKVVGFAPTWFHIIEWGTSKNISAFALSCRPLFFCQITRGGEKTASVWNWYH